MDSRTCKNETEKVKVHTRNHPTGRHAHTLRKEEVLDFWPSGRAGALELREGGHG